MGDVMKEDDSSYKRGQDNKQLEIAWFRESEGQSPLSEKMTNVGLGDQRQNLKTERERMRSTGLVTFRKDQWAESGGQESTSHYLCI